MVLARSGPSEEERVRSPGVMERGTPLKLFPAGKSNSGDGDRAWTPVSTGSRGKVLAADYSKKGGGSSRLYGSSTSSAQAEARRAMHTSRDHETRVGASLAPQVRSRDDPLPTPPEGGRPKRGQRFAPKFISVSAERSGASLSSLASGPLHTEVQVGGMDIGCFQVKRVLQDMEQTVREKSRREEIGRLKRARSLGKKKVEADRRDLDMSGKLSRRANAKSRAHFLKQEVATVIAITREEAGFKLLLQVLVEAGDEGKGDLGQAAGLARHKAEQADPLILADFLVARCDGLCELVLDITDQLTAGVMGLRRAAPAEEVVSLETSVVRGWSPDDRNAALGNFAHNYPTKQIGEHPFADAETLDFILDQLLLTISSAARASAGQTPRAATRSANGETIRPTEVGGSPLSMMDAIMVARLKAQDEGGDVHDSHAYSTEEFMKRADHFADDTAHGKHGRRRQTTSHVLDLWHHDSGPRARDGNMLWSKLNAKRKMAMISNETVAQIAPILMKYGLMDFAKDLKKYDFHQLPQLRKASVGQLVQLGMSSQQATSLLLAVNPSAISEGRGSARVLPHGITVAEDAWFHKKVAKKPARPSAPVTMKDLHAPFQNSHRYKEARRQQRERDPKPPPELEMTATQRQKTIDKVLPQPDLDAPIEPEPEASRSNFIMRNNPYETLSPSPPPRPPTTESERLTRQDAHFAERTFDYDRVVKEMARALKVDLREEQEADSWLKSQPLQHRRSNVDMTKQQKGEAMRSTFNMKTAATWHTTGFSVHGTTNHTRSSGTTSQVFGAGLAGVDECHSREYSPSASIHARVATGVVGHTSGLAGLGARLGTRATGSFAESMAAGETAAESSTAHSSATLAEMDEEIQLGMNRVARSHVYVGDPRFIPTDLTQVHRGNASYSGREFIDRWSSLQSHSPRSIEERKQMMRIDAAWQPKTVRSFRVDRVVRR